MTTDHGLRAALKSMRWREWLLLPFTAVAFLLGAVMGAICLVVIAIRDRGFFNDHRN